MLYVSHLYQKHNIYQRFFGNYMENMKVYVFLLTLYLHLESLCLMCVINDNVCVFIKRERESKNDTYTILQKSFYSVSLCLCVCISLSHAHTHKHRSTYDNRFKINEYKIHINTYKTFLSFSLSHTQTHTYSLSLIIYPS